MYKKWAVLAAAICLLFLSAPLARAQESPDGAPIRYFYDNPCASCDPAGEFVALFNELVGDLKEEADFRLQLVNVFPDGRERLLEAAEAAGVPEEARHAPLLLIGDGWLCGDTAIREGLRALFCEQFGLAAPPISPPPPQADAAAEETSPREIPNGTLYMRYYYRDTCPDCRKVRDLLASFEAGHPRLRFDRLSVEEARRLDELYLLYDRFGVENDRREIPAIFWQGGALICEEITAESLGAALNGAAYGGFADFLPGQVPASGDRRLPPWVVAAALAAAAVCVGAALWRARKRPRP